MPPERNCRSRCCLWASASKWRPASLLPGEEAISSQSVDRRA
jgi:hypothetical protein